MAKQTFTTGQVLTAAQMTSLQQTAMGGGSTTAKTTSYVLVAADAGTVIQMNAAGATTITVNTALFAAGDTVQIQNVGAGVCTVTAGTATVSTAGSLALSQYEGGQLYFNTTSAALFFDIVQTSGMTNPLTTTGDTIYSSSGTTPARLGIGSTGNVLTVAAGIPSWAAPAGSMTDIASGSLSGSSLALTSIVGTYKNLVLVMRNYTTGTDFDLNGKINSLVTTGDYAYALSETTTTNAAAPATIGYYSISSYGFNNSLIDNTDGDNSLVLTIYDYADTTANKAMTSVQSYKRSTGQKVVCQSYGAVITTAAVTAITMTPTAGTWTAGTYTLYGVN